MKSQIEQLEDKMDTLQKGFDKAERGSIKLYYWTVRIVSIAALILSFVCAFYGYGLSALVMAGLFLLIWFFYCFALGVSKAWVKNIELELEKEKNKINSKPYVRKN